MSTKHFDDFIKSGVYLRAWSPKTVRTYRQGLNAFQTALAESHLSAAGDVSPISKSSLDTFVL